MKSTQYIISLALCLALSVCVNANEETAFNQAYKAYLDAQAKGDAKTTLPFAKKAFDIGAELFNADSENLLALADNYASLLISTGDIKTALKVYKDLISTNERYYGKYAPSLIPILKTLYEVELKAGNGSAQKTKQRYVKLLYRHNPDQIATTIKETPLSRPQTEHIQKDIQAILNEDYALYEGDHWVTLYSPEAKKGVELFDKQLELSYASIRSFLISMSLTTQAIDEKQVAVLFKNEDDYMTFIETKGLHIRGKGSFEEDYDTLLMYDNIEDHSEWKFFKKTNIVAQEAVQQVLLSAMIFSSDRRYYPYWLYDGIGYSFEFNDISKTFGPHTKNLSSTNWSRAQDLIDTGQWISIKKLIRMSKEDEVKKENKEVIYIIGTYLIRFLYEKHPDELVEYFNLLPRQDVNNQKPSNREKTFRKAFGKPEDLEKDWKKYLAAQGITFM